jgi:hypothetical protein
VSSGGSSGAGGTPNCTTTDVSLNDGTMGTGTDEFDYQGGWLTSAAAGKYQGDDHYSSTAGDTATLRFDGVAAAFHSAKAPHHGIAEVSIDGGSPTDVDLYAATRADDVEVWQSGTLSPGSHVLTIRVSGRRNAASTGDTVAVERRRHAFGVTGQGSERRRSRRSRDGWRVGIGRKHRRTSGSGVAAALYRRPPRLPTPGRFFGVGSKL